MAGSAKAEFSGQLSKLAQKRLVKERQNLMQERQELEDCGIHVHWGEELNKALALIIGPTGTPYQRGFYFFDIKMPDNYPFVPPKVDFKTGDGRVRFNPNLYVEGKVCLSILGTWSGPSWTTSCSLRTVLVSIQSLLNEHPIQNEPGLENEKGKADQEYSEIIRYENIAVGVVRMFEKTPPNFVVFRPAMRRIFLQHFNDYLNTLETYAPKEGKTSRSDRRLGGFQVRFTPKDVIRQLRELQESLQREDDAAAAAVAQASGAAATGASGAAVGPAVAVGAAAAAAPAPAPAEPHGAAGPRGTKRPAPEA